MGLESGNEAIARRAIETWNENDWDAMQALCHPDVSATAPRQWPESGDEKGWPAVRRQYERLKESWSEEHVEILGLRAAGATVLVHCRWVGKAATSGLDLDLETWLVCRFEDARIVWMGFFLEQGEALRAAGIPSAEDAA
jgi:ketosteroid isomerase-like protein